MRARLVILALALAVGCGAPRGRVRGAAAAPPPASLRLSLREGRLEGELRAVGPVEPFILQEPARVLSIEGPAGPIGYRTDPRWASASIIDVAPTRSALTVRFAADGLDEAMRQQSHVSVERVELGGWYWYPALATSLMVEVTSALPPSMRLLGSGVRRRDGRWYVAPGERFALVGIAEPGELRAERARIVYDAGWLDGEDARDLVERASDAVTAFERAFGPAGRRALTIAMPPREGGGYWTDGLLVIGQYYAGYGRDDDDREPEPIGARGSGSTVEPGLTVESGLTVEPGLGVAPGSGVEAGLASSGYGARSVEEMPLDEVRTWRRYAVVHEVAHEWWHGYPEIAGWLSLDEGLAQYAVLMVADEEMREQALAHHVRSMIDDALHPGRRAPGWNTDAYDRSPLYFLALEHTFGAARLQAFLRAIREAQASLALDEPTFRRLLRERLGPRAVELLDERTGAR